MKMLQRIKEQIDSWDFRSIFQTLVALFIIFFILFYFQNIRDKFRQGEREEFKGQAVGQVISIKPRERIDQTRTRGTEILVDSYDVLFQYRVSGKVYQGTDNIPSTGANRKLINDLLDEEKWDNVLVAFDLGDPGKSILIERK